MEESIMRVIHKIIEENAPFPNNPKLPFLHYEQALEGSESGLEIFEKNGWKNGWENGIYRFHHFHSNTHEALAIDSGSCEVQIGGDEGEIFTVRAKDVIIIPAGVSHKNVECSSDFRCAGAYPFAIQYDMHRGDEGEWEKVKRAIEKVPLPKKDPVFGESGPLFEYWH